ncbi:hypothetical protein PtA15_6A638 [Puccinia triticina]|uniref:NET domain-containing protein n=1 Tax=Puccinia triticina TaxID=208348 RepID=A0ABY7CNT3_9BASI|nr:uncharacterized protein PtA15_6A638 [Puccinia triticina]WAQ86008.1 hypothetical protein PtA15_6A638 [Puccinia triticina]WAR55906.1 hypothetical protein PtB15_6B650 [Puccinia triticina]
MSSSSIDLGKTILAKLEQLSAKKPNAANRARSGSKADPKKESTGSNAAQKPTPSSSDKPPKKDRRKDRKAKQLAAGSSSAVRHEKSPVKSANPCPDIPAPDPGTTSKQEASDEASSDKPPKKDRRKDRKAKQLAASSAVRQEKPPVKSANACPDIPAPDPGTTSKQEASDEAFSDKPPKKDRRKDRKAKQLAAGSSSAVRQEKLPVKEAHACPDIPAPDPETTSKQEASDEASSDKPPKKDRRRDRKAKQLAAGSSSAVRQEKPPVKSANADIDDEVLLAEIKNLGGTAEDLDLLEGSPWKQAVIAEEHVADDALVDDVKSFMQGLDFEAALKSMNSVAKESSPRPANSEGSTHHEQDPPSPARHPKRKATSTDLSSDHTSNQPKKKKKNRKSQK